MSKKIFVCISIFLLTVISFCSVQAEEYPEKPIKLITAYAPGGGSDACHRIIQKYATQFMKERFVIIYKKGAGGELGFTYLADSKPDGYTIGGVNVPQILIQPLLRKKGEPGYQTEDLVPVCQHVTDAHCIVVHKDSPWKTFEDFVAYVKENPGRVTVGTGGKYSGQHFFLMEFEEATGLKLAHVPFKGGGGPARAAVATKQIDSQFATVNNFITTENVRALVVTSRGRYPLCPDVPTMKEKGIDLVLEQPKGICAPKGTPKEKIKYIENVIRKCHELDSYQEDMRKMGFIPEFLSSEEFGDYIQKRKVKTKKILEKMGRI